MKKAIQLLVTMAFLAIAGNTFGGWKFGQDVIDVVRGKKPLEVKPYVALSHDGKRVQISPEAVQAIKDGKKIFELGSDNLYLRFGDLTVQTHQLRKRLLQAGCVIESGGNIALCAPDVFAREVQKLAQTQQANPRVYPNNQQSPSLPYNPQQPVPVYGPQQQSMPRQQQSMPSSFGNSWNMPQAPMLYCCDPATKQKVCVITTGAGTVGSPCYCNGVYGTGYACF
jgi:hypothetical protein